MNPDSVGESSIKRAVDQRLAYLDIKTSSEYFMVLSNSPSEINELIEEVVVPETWFFRNRTPFNALAEYTKKVVIPNLKDNEKIRILSVPCSTGEEPCSIAMTLLNEGIPPKQINIDAIDVSKRALTKARRAIYGKNSFRDVDETVIEKYFNKIHSGQQLDESVRGVVNYKLGNLLVGSLSPHPGYYDVIFCRNLLIYFNREIQLIALEKLHRALKVGGALFVGHVEMTHLPRDKFRKYDHPKSFAYLKNVMCITNKAVAGSEFNKDNHNANLIKKDSVLDATPNVSQISLKNINPAHTQETAGRTLISPAKHNRKDLLEAEKLENENHYSAAIALCESYLESEPDSAQAYYLLGLIYHSQGDNKKSESFLKKSVYLDPNHENAMILSLLLAELRNDEEAIKSFKRRIERIERRNKC